MMKRIICSFLCMVICVSMCACEKKSSNINLTIDTYSTSDGSLVFDSDVAESENGYYILGGNGHSNRYIGYIDKETNESTVLCSKVNCTHDTEGVTKNCDAYIGSVVMGSINYYNGYVYYIDYNQSSYGCSLCRVSGDGSEHEVVCNLGAAPDNSNGYYSYVVTDKYVIYSESIGNSKEKNKAELRVYDMKNKSTETIYSYEENYAWIYDLKIMNGNICFRQTCGTGAFESDIYVYDTKECKVERLIEDTCSYGMIDEHTIVYWRSYDGIYKRNIDTKTDVKIYASDEDTQVGFLANSGDDVYVYNFSNSGSKIFIGIIDNGELVSKTYANDGGSYMRYVYVGTDRVIASLYQQDGIYYGYCMTKDKSIEDTRVKTVILSM